VRGLLRFGVSSRPRIAAAKRLFQRDSSLRATPALWQVDAYGMAAPWYTASARGPAAGVRRRAQKLSTEPALAPTASSGVSTSRANTGAPVSGVSRPTKIALAGGREDGEKSTAPTSTRIAVRSHASRPWCRRCHSKASRDLKRDGATKAAPAASVSPELRRRRRRTNASADSARTSAITIRQTLRAKLQREVRGRGRYASARK